MKRVSTERRGESLCQPRLGKPHCHLAILRKLLVRTNSSLFVYVFLFGLLCCARSLAWFPPTSERRGQRLQRFKLGQSSSHLDFLRMYSWTTVLSVSPNKRSPFLCYYIHLLHCFCFSLLSLHAAFFLKIYLHHFLICLHFFKFHR